jgi:hypothetical protein
MHWERPNKMARDGKLSNFVHVGKFGTGRNLNFDLRNMPEITAEKLIKKAAKKLIPPLFFVLVSVGRFTPKIRLRLPHCAANSEGSKICREGLELLHSK